MLLTTIFLISAIQGLAYWIVWRTRFTYGRLLVLIIVLTTYFFFLPPLFSAQHDLNESRCGLPIFAITMAFWFMGGVSAFIVHFISYLILRKRIRKQI